VPPLFKYLKISVLLIAQMFLFKNVISQNLINNNSFENYTGISCPYGSFDNYNAFPSYHILDDWYTLNSCDYYNSICTPINNGFSVPNNIIGSSQSKQGNAYVGAILFCANYETKEYLYQQLSTPLQAGKIYCLSFYVSRVDRVTHAIHSIGAYFSNNVQSASVLGYINALPQVVNQTGFISDTVNWVEVQGCFTANGGEQYITIGNFNSNANTDTLFVGSTDPHPGAYKYAYYYIDDITLIDQTTVGVNELGENNEIGIYPNPTSSTLKISDKKNQFENAIVKITNYLGETIYIKPFSNQIDCTTFSSGIYFLTVQDKFTTKTVKFIKQ
jgi:hypothetical protein